METQLYVYEWHPRGGGDEDSPCAECTDREGTYMERPSRPHPKCRCDIVLKPDICTLQSRYERETAADEPQAEVLDFVQPGSSTNVTYGNSRTSGSKRTGSGEVSGLTGTVEESESSTTSEQHSQNVAHDPSLSDGPQVIVNFYQSFQVFVLEQWHCTLHGDVFTSRTETRSRLVHQELFPAGAEPYEMPGSGGGDAGGGDEDFDFTDEDVDGLFDE
ncbi:MAG: hypothetical protein ACK2UK_20070 [Candidatus Promineifilaceae bacterium]